MYMHAYKHMCIYMYISYISIYTHVYRSIYIYKHTHTHLSISSYTTRTPPVKCEKISILEFVLCPKHASFDPNHTGPKKLGSTR